MASTPRAAASIRFRRRLLAPLVCTVLAVLLFLALFASVIFFDRNFIFRDAGHFYYPLFKQVAAEWGAGRVPLWNPLENCGMPLLANPTSSVFYPLKLLFVLPFAAAFKWYHLAHLPIAGGLTYWCARRMGISGWGAGLAGLAYAFNSFVVFQIYNVIFLCSAAWLPAVVLATDRVVRRPSATWAIVMAGSAALQVLGGDPQTVYLEFIAAGFYAIFYHLGLRRGMMASGWIVCIGAPFVARTPFNEARAAGAGLATAIASTDIAAGVFALAIACIGAVLAFRGRELREKRGWRDLARSMIAIGAAAGLAAAMSAVQILPTLELIAVSDRSAPDAPHEPMAFSFFPLRALEAVVPAVWGRQLPIHTRWAPFRQLETGIWTPTTYMGLVPLLLGIAAIRIRRGSIGMRWLSWMAMISFWLSVGKFGGVAWLFDKNLGQAVNPVAAAAGTKLYGESGGLYWFCEATLPGMGAFRYPNKLLVFTTFALAVLAGSGLDRLRRRQDLLARFAMILSGLSVALLLALFVFRAAFEAWIKTIPQSMNSFGPLATSLAWRHLTLALLHCGISAGAFWAILQLTRKTPPRRVHAIAALLALVTGIDLFLANRWLVLSDEQGVIDETPAVVQAIADAESKDPAPQPFRVHRTRIYEPLHWSTTSDPARLTEMSRWERKTIQPKYGLPFGINYTITEGTMSIYDVEFFFAPWVVDAPAEVRAAYPKFPARMTYYPRQGYNLWATRYFVLPRLPKFDDDDRGVFTFLATAAGAPCPVVAESPPEQDDYVVLKNPEAFPRAWIVHRIDVRPPIVGLRRADRSDRTEELVYREFDAGLPVWQGRRRSNYPFETQVMVETDHPERLAPFVSGAKPTSNETLRFEADEPDRIRLTVTMETSGFVVLADAFYDGWQATVDGIPAEIVRSNRAMRAVGVPAGAHAVEFVYRCWRFEVGLAISAAAWLASGVALAMLWSRRM